MKYIGVHVSALPDVSVAPLEAHALGADAFAFNLVDAQAWKTPPYTPEAVASFRDSCREFGYSPSQILPHSAFVVNLGSPDARKLALSRKVFTDELSRCMQLELTMLNFHPGAHLGKIPEEESLDTVARSINLALAATEGVKAVIENTAGQGSYLGYSFAHLAAIIDRVDDKSRVGVCIDTCHAIAAGYDITTAEGYDKVWKEFETVVGFQYLRGMHINDSMRGVGTRVDRHAPIGDGTVGTGFFRRLMADPRFDGIPMILETPDPARWQSEISLLKSWAAGR